MKKLIEKIIKNGGATLTSTLENADLKNGYMVSEVGAERVFGLDEVEEIEKTLIEYAEKITTNQFVGAWLDDDKLYIDISRHYKSKKQALRVGADNKQLAIYDIANEESIYITRSVFILYAVDKVLDDIRNIAEYNSLQDIEEEFKEVIGNRIEEICKEHDVEVDYAYQSLTEIPGEFPAERTN